MALSFLFGHISRFVFRSLRMDFQYFKWVSFCAHARRQDAHPQTNGYR